MLNLKKALQNEVQTVLNNIGRFTNDFEMIELQADASVARLHKLMDTVPNKDRVDLSTTVWKEAQLNLKNTFGGLKYTDAFNNVKDDTINNLTVKLKQSISCNLNLKEFSKAMNERYIYA